MEKKFKTNDLYFIGFLYAENIEPIEIEGFGNRKTFYYSDSDFEEIKIKYYARKCRVEPIEFQQGLRLAKSIIYNN